MLHCSSLAKCVLVIVAVHYIVFGIVLLALNPTGFYHISQRAVVLLQGKSGKTHDRAFDLCVLSELPPWTDDIKQLMDPAYDPLANCSRNFTPLTVLEKDGRVQLNPKYEGPPISCKARALLHAAERAVTFDEWHALEERFVFATDIVEVDCNNGTYGWLHYQIWKGERLSGPDPGVDPFGGEAAALIEEQLTGQPRMRPNVFLILFDSIATTQARRSFPMTLSYLEKEFESISFRHVNRVGENSAPNGAAMLFNMLLTPINRQIYGGESIEPDYSLFNFCHRFHDNDSFIIKDYEAFGYKTMMAEDWAAGVFNWPGCCGFVKQPTTHYMRPFQNRFEHKDSPARKQMSMKNCLERHMFLFDYLGMFIKEYPDSPKFALTWASDLAHDNYNTPFHADGYLYDFFENNHETLDNSFLFFMGDHGLRHGRQLKTKLGKIEVNNPMLWISVPKSMRSNADVMRNMRRNAGQLVTHFDTYATLVDILKHAPLSNFTEWQSTHSVPADRGGSLLRPLPAGERHCRTLPIPPQYCLCEIERTEITDETTKENAGAVAVHALNEIIKANKIDEFCLELTLDKVEFLHRIHNTEGLYEVEFGVLPSGGIFQTLLHGTEVGEFEHNLPSMQRQNEYEKAGDCIEQNDLRPYCYCANMTTTTFIGTSSTPSSTPSASVEVTSPTTTATPTPTDGLTG